MPHMGKHPDVHMLSPTAQAGKETQPGKSPPLHAFTMGKSLRRERLRNTKSSPQQHGPGNGHDNILQHTDGPGTNPEHQQKTANATMDSLTEHPCVLI